MPESNVMHKTAVSMVIILNNYDLEMPSSQDGKIVSEFLAGPWQGQDRPLNPHRFLSSDVRNVDRCHGVTAMPDGRRP